MGWKNWTRERLSVPDLQEHIQDQVVMRFASGSARGAQLPAPEEGMVCYLEDVNRWEGYGPGADGITLEWTVIAYAGPRPVLRVQRTAPQSIPSGGFTNLAWDTELEDSHNMHNGGLITIKRAGLWQVTAGYNLSGNVAGRRAVRVMRATAAAPATPIPTGIGRNVGAAGTDNGVEASGTVRLGLNDSLTVGVFHDTAGAQNTSNPDYGPTKLDLVWLSA